VNCENREIGTRSFRRAQIDICLVLEEQFQNARGPMQSCDMNRRISHLVDNIQLCPVLDEQQRRVGLVIFRSHKQEGSAIDRILPVEGHAVVQEQLQYFFPAQGGGNFRHSEDGAAGGRRQRLVAGNERRCRFIIAGKKSVKNIFRGPMMFQQGSSGVVF